jgi:hypothetical protein
MVSYDELHILCNSVYAHYSYSVKIVPTREGESTDLTFCLILKLVSVHYLISLSWYLPTLDH